MLCVPSAGPTSKCCQGQKLLISLVKDQSIPVESLQATSSRHFFSARRRLSHYLRDHRIDLLQTFLYHGNILGAVAKVADDQFVRVGGIRVADPSRWRQRLEGWAARRWNHVICVSNDVAAQASQYSLGAEMPLHVAVNVGRFVKCDLSLFNRSCYVNNGIYQNLGRRELLM